MLDDEPSDAAQRILSLLESSLLLGSRERLQLQSAELGVPHVVDLVGPRRGQQRVTLRR